MWAKITCRIVEDERGDKCAEIGKGVFVHVQEAKHGGEVVQYVRYGGVDFKVGEEKSKPKLDDEGDASKDVEGLQNALGWTNLATDLMHSVWNKIQRDLESSSSSSSSSDDEGGPDLTKYAQMDSPLDLPKDSEEQTFIVNFPVNMFNLRGAFASLVAADLYEKGLPMRLFKAARQGQVEILDYIHHEVAKLGEKKGSMQDLDVTPVIHIAALLGHTRVVEYMVKTFGNDILLKYGGEKELQPIHCACFYGSLETVKYIASTVPKCVDSAMYQGLRPLHLAAMLPNVETLQYLLVQGADVHAKDEAGHAPIHYAAALGIPSSIRLLLAHGAPVDSLGASGLQPIHMAAAYGKSANIKFLVQNGASVHACTPGFGLQPLTIASTSGTYIIMSLLKDLGADVTAKMKNGATALHFAIRVHSVPVWNRLLEYGAVLDAADHKGVQSMHEAAAAGNLDAVKWLFSKNVRIDCEDADGCQPLHKAIVTGQYLVVEWLLSKGVRLDGRCDRGKTVLHLASANGKSAVLQLLLRNGAKEHLNAKDFEGRTPLHLAAKNKHRDLMKMLTEEGADETIMDDNHKTAHDLLQASSAGDTDAFMQMLKILSDSMDKLPPHK